MPSQGSLCLVEVKEIEKTKRKREISCKENFQIFMAKKSDRVVWDVGRGKEGRTNLLLSLNLYE